MLNKNTVNKVILLGRIATQPTWERHSNLLYLCFTLLTTEQLKSGGETQVHEEKHNIIVPDRLKDVDSLGAGDVLYLQGKLQTKMTIDDDRIKRYRSEIVAISIEQVEVHALFGLNTINQ